MAILCHLCLFTSDTLSLICQGALQLSGLIHAGHGVKLFYSILGGNVAVLCRALMLRALRL